MKKVFLAFFFLASASALEAQVGTLVIGTFKSPTGQTCAALGIRTVIIGGTAMCGELLFMPYDLLEQRPIPLRRAGITYVPQPAKAWIRASDNALMSYDPVAGTVSVGIRVIPNVNSTPAGAVYRLQARLYEPADGSAPATDWIERKAIPDQASADWGTLPIS